MIFRKIQKIQGRLWNNWFQITPTKSSTSNYGHMLFKKISGANLSQLQTELIPFFEEAHRDARDIFHNEIGINLDPLAPTPVSQVTYPNSLPEKQKKGFFGEVLCGIVVQHFGTICNNTWNIPAFLFRHHDTASQYLHKLHYGAEVPSEIVGRTGNDFLAITIDNKENIIGFLVGEAKFRKKFSQAPAKQAYKDLSNHPVIPVDLSKIKKLITHLYPGQYTQLVQSIEQIIFSNQQNGLARTDVLIYIFEDPNISSFPPSRINSNTKDPNYKANRQLQVYEIYLPGAGNLIKDLYQNLYP